MNPDLYIASESWLNARKMCATSIKVFLPAEMEKEEWEKMNSLSFPAKEKESETFWEVMLLNW